MKPIRYTDQHRYPNGYRKAAETNVEATFKRARQEQKAKAAQQAANQAEAQSKTLHLPRKVAK